MTTYGDALPGGNTGAIELSRLLATAREFSADMRASPIVRRAASLLIGSPGPNGIEELWRLCSSAGFLGCWPEADFISHCRDYAARLLRGQNECVPAASTAGAAALEPPLSLLDEVALRMAAPNDDVSIKILSSMLGRAPDHPNDTGWYFEACAAYRYAAARAFLKVRAQQNKLN